MVRYKGSRSPLRRSAAGFLDGTGILHSCLWPFSLKECVLQISREEQGVIRTFTHFHPPGSCSVSSVSQRFIDRPLAPTAEVSVSARAQCEGKEKGKDRASAERDKAQQLLSACTHTQSVLAWLLLATPPSSLLCSRPVSLFSGRYMCSELRLRKQSRARAKGAHTHQQTAFFNRSGTAIIWGTETSR